MDDATYLVAVKTHDLSGLDEFTAYLSSLSHVEVMVVDGSATRVYEEHARRWMGRLTHIVPDPQIQGLNGKTRGVLSGLRRARHEKIIIADDDVRYAPATLKRMVALLDEYDVVRPQNYFAPHAWHTVLDSARIVLNRVTAGDWPGTLGIRRSAVGDGYNADVLFENLELVRTIVARGGRELLADDVYVARRPPSVRHFWSQRTRQAYDEFARPGRLAGQLTLLPALAFAVWGRRWAALVGVAFAAIALAEAGRRRKGGMRFFPAAASIAAPLWLLERGVCAWLAVLSRARHGGVAYSGTVIKSAASSMRELRRLGA
ncbi:MAG: glycosyltransferase family 2 protein [Candidatus Eremiobacteraeota bacterium]|nr:glycosyltransferase family 2 protein [Candidatus Eremiobacteraeota bacterium]MBC5826373.1 glycosyltransferase family 2 protein [Candidatus Eremiobacteraeota bacterium]